MRNHDQDFVHPASPNFNVVKSKQTAVNTIVDAAHAAAADDGLRDASVVNIEMGEAGGLLFLLFPIIYPMYGLHMCRILANMGTRCCFLRREPRHLLPLLNGGRRIL